MSKTIDPPQPSATAFIGHTEVVKHFQATLQRGRLASTYLLVGEEGIGKRTFALHLAAALLCNESEDQSLTPCGQCESCLLFVAGNHPDLLSIAKPSDRATLPIDLFLGPSDRRNREGLCHDIALKPFIATRRVAILDDADYLSIESANCLLKTLEEPPPRSVLLLIGTSLSRQLPTIRSRSQVIRFQPLKNEEVAAVLTATGKLEEGQDANALARQSGGSVLKALAADGGQLEAFGVELQKTLSGETFDPVGLGTHIQDLVAEAGTEAALRRHRLRGIISTAIDFYRQQLRQIAAEGSLAESTLHRLDACLAALEHIDRNANQATLVQTWLNRLAM